jgi:hypothetical protein
LPIEDLLDQLGRIQKFTLRYPPQGLFAPRQKKSSEAPEAHL